MKKSHEIDQRVKCDIIDSINGDGYGAELKTVTQKIEFLRRAFEADYGWAIGRYGKQEATRKWLHGLPITADIPIKDCDILENAVEIGILPANAMEKQKGKFLASYWNFLWYLMQCKVISL